MPENADMNKLAVPKLLWITLLYSALSFVQPAVSLLLQPLYWEHLTTEEYAILTLMNNYASLVSILGTCYLSSAVFSFYYDYRHNPHRLMRFLGQMLSFSFKTSLFFGVFSLLVGEWVFGMVFRDHSLRFFPYGCWATFGGLAMALFAPLLIYFNNERKVLGYATLQIGMAMALLALQWIWVVLWDGGASGALVGRALANWTGVLATLWVFRKHLSLHTDWRYLKKPLHFVRYSLPAAVLEWAGSFGDRFVVERFLSLTTVAVYGALATLMGLAEMLFFAIRAAIQPQLYGVWSMTKGQNYTLSSEVLRLHSFYGSVCLLVVSGVLCGVMHIDWLTHQPDYWQMRGYAGVYAAAYLFVPMIHLGLLRYHFQKDSRSVMQYGIFSLLAMLFFNALLIGWWGLKGAVAAALLVRASTACALLWKQAELRHLYTQATQCIPWGIMLLVLLNLEIWRTAANFTYHTAGILQFGLCCALLLFANAHNRVFIWQTQ